MSTKQYTIIVFVTVFAILMSFFSGFYLKESVLNYKSNQNYQTNFNQQLFKPNFIDEAIITTDSTPKITLIISAIRTYRDTSLNNYTIKAFYYDGEKWLKEIAEGTSKELENIPSTIIVPKWEILNDPSYMLRQSVSGTIEIDQQKIKFTIPLIENEIGIRSFYKYTKFISESKGEIFINNKKYNANVVYSRIYSFNPPESLIFTSDPSGIETEWLAFWDEGNNFYTIDETTVDNKITKDTYKAHSIAVKKDVQGKISKSFLLSIFKTDTNDYRVEIGEPINETLTIQKINFSNKSINGSDIWNTGQTKGSVKTSNGKIINGFGIFESISQ